MNKEVKKYLDTVFTEYDEDLTMNEYNILHMYPKGIAYPNGYLDSQFFELIGYNTITRKFKNLGSNHDSIRFFEDSTRVNFIRIFADGSTMICFKSIVKISCLTQEVYI